MCGFVVALAREPVTASRLDAMERALRHRGPDERGAHAEGPLAMRHRRLRIIDLDGGKQPMAGADGRVWLVYNGEIYNFEALRETLRARGHVFRERSDTEVLLAAWLEWGPDCVERLDGMFAFVVHDARGEGGLFAARDRFGEKPLYWVETSEGLFLASELKALVAGGVVAREVDPQVLHAYFTCGFGWGERAVFRGVRRLAAAGWLRFDAARGVRVGSYWRLPPAGGGVAGEAEAVDRSEALLRESVRRRMVADVPLGFFLSGGVDSSAVVALAREASDQPLETFAMGFDEPRFDERPHARAVAERLGTRHHELLLEPASLGVIDRLAWHLDEPFADPAALPTWFLCEAAREQVTVALSGDGGDELFAGYDVYRAHAISERLRRGVPGPLLRAAAAALRRAPAPGASGRARLERLARNVEDAARPPPERFVAKQQNFLRPELLAEGAPALHEAGGPALVREQFAALFAGGQGPLDAIAEWQLRVGLPDDMMVKVDRTAMAHSLEVRAPLLDHRLAELARGMPMATKLAGGRPKRILRRVLERHLPPELVWRPKRTFAVPLHRWFHGDLAGHARGRLLRPDARVARVFAPGFLARLLDEHAAGRRDRSRAIWALLVYESWAGAMDVDPAPALEGGGD